MAAESSQQLLFTLICLLYALLCFFAPHAAPLSFSFDFSSSADDPCSTQLRCEDSASFRSPSIVLTTNQKNRATQYSTGRVSFADPVRLRNVATGELASFTTTFSFRIIQSDGPAGDGMAFFLGHYPSRIPPSSNAGALGLVSHSQIWNATGNGSIVAVEFDPCSDPPWDESHGHHIGIDVNSIKSVKYTDVSNLTTGDVMTAWVRYDNATKLLAADLQMKGTLYHVNATVNLSNYLPEEVAVGFSASTGGSVEVHEVRSWTFNSTLNDVPKSHLPLARGKLLTAVLVPALFAMVACGIGIHLWRQHARTKASNEASDSESSEEEKDESEFEIGLAPRRYRYRRLADAASNFAEEKKLGRGGFGNVYKGQLSDQDRPVAIKMLSTETSSQGRKEFEAEVKTISRLRHRNLVQLLGWCDSHKGLLLVYEYVVEGSLDRHIHSIDRWLTWPERYNIILGLGSALHYLHEEWEQCVVHGDIKPSNIMLDSLYNAKLGDFGLARLIDHGTGPRTTHAVLGTAGYIDPEFVNTRRQSKESDIYSFGIVLLELVSGRHPVEQQPDDQFFVLLKWVRNLHGNNTILEAADERLRGDDELEERQMERVLVVGLWCAHPDQSERPSISQAMHVLSSGDSPLPALALQMYNNAANVAISQGAYSVFPIDNSSSVYITTARSS